METEADLIQYHKSVARELASTRDRVRNLIGSRHWLTDGEHKEVVLRKVLRNHVPENTRVGKGFVFLGSNTSTQMDVLLSDRSRPTLFKEEDLTIVTPDAVQGIIEVKTSIDSKSSLAKIITKLCDNAEIIRGQHRHRSSSWFGLFVYQPLPSNITDKDVLTIVQAAVRGQPSRAIDAIALGPDRIVRFVEEEERKREIEAPAWLLYHLKDLAQAYFINYLVWHLASNTSWSLRSAWFPMVSTQKYYIKKYVPLHNSTVRDFPANLSEKLQFYTKTPAEASPQELGDFKKLVEKSEQVSAANLDQRIQRAERLAFCYHRGALVGAAALKQPLPNRVSTTFTKAQTNEAAGEYAIELGWLMVEDGYRHQGIGKTLVSSLVGELQDRKAYATAREDSITAKLILRLYGFEETGAVYKSSINNEMIRLLVRK